MKTSIRFIGIGIIAAGILVLASVQSANAQAVLTDEQKQRIVGNCSSIKTALNQLHASDALLRVNRGQIYEAMSSRLMDNFNTRLGNNNQDTRGLSVISNGYKTTLNTFRSDYLLYERQLSAVIGIDCTKAPEAFHYALEDARTKRLKVHTDVLKLHQNIDDYRSSVNDFLLNFQRLNGDG
jgi:hypothetical protein